MTSGSSIPELEFCARHRKVETSLRCNRCDTLICPQCMVYTPAGVRCPDCVSTQASTVPEYQAQPGTGEEFCARHPDVETGLRCGRCDTLICPQCMVYTPAGVRCPDCAQLRRPPMYELNWRHYLLATGAALAVGVLLGIAAAVLIPMLRIGFFFLQLLIGLLAGVGGGTIMAEAMSRATRHKRGTAMQVIALGGIALAATIYVFGSRFSPAFAIQDLTTWAVVAGAVISAWGRLR